MQKWPDSSRLHHATFAWLCEQTGHHALWAQALTGSEPFVHPAALICNAGDVHIRLKANAALAHLRSTLAQGTTSLTMCRSTDTSLLMKWIGSWQLAALQSLRNELALSHTLSHHLIRDRCVACGPAELHTRLKLSGNDWEAGPLHMPDMAKQLAVQSGRSQPPNGS